MVFTILKYYDSLIAIRTDSIFSLSRTVALSRDDSIASLIA